MLAHQVENGHLHHALIEVCRSILDNLHRDNLLCLQVLAFHNLTERPLTQNVENEITISIFLELVNSSVGLFKYPLVAIVFIAENIVHVKNIVTVFVVETIVLDSFTGFSQDPSWIPRGFVFERRIADSVGRW